MRVISARIGNYRTVQQETLIEMERGQTLVGPNNAGKTNILKAMRLFFTGYDNSLGYSREHDLSFGQAQRRTNVAMAFRIEDRDGPDIQAALDQLTDILGVSPQKSSEFTIYLTFSQSSNPTYRVYPNSKRPVGATEKAQYSRYEKAFVESVLSRFAVHYIPSDKSTEQLYNELVLPFLLRKAFHAITPHLLLIRNAMDEAASSLNNSLTAAGLGQVASSFAFPDEPKRFFKDVDFTLSDPTSTSIFNKGMGIQSAALLAAFNWITDEEVSDGKSVLWLLEEPESYLHPELASQCERMINELRLKSQVVCTTHSLGFVPQDPASVLGVERELGWTKTQTFKTYYEATDRIRKSLGVKFSDFYNLNYFNVLVEGETDREYLQRFTKLLTKHALAPVFPILTSTAVAFLDQGGVSGLSGFVRATYQFIRTERPCVIMLDGDAAGDKCRRELQGYLGQKQIPFQPNQQFIVIRDRYTIEGLFPDDWIASLHDDHGAWFEDYSTDAQGGLMPFGVRDNYKRNFMGAMMARAEAEADLNWAARWTSVLTTIETALQTEATRIYGTPEEVAKVLAIAIPKASLQSSSDLEQLLVEPVLVAD